ncbi:MAG TPA: glycosyltransferase [Solirubrobacteraceae bacterium]|nr:glycosyltransferase [Solirubrobacteraceae bacterium]
MRLAVYTDYEYRAEGGHRYGQRAFVVFLEALRPHLDRLVLVGRLDPRPGPSHYPLRDDTELVGLPHYESLLSPLSVARSLVASLAVFWRLLDDVDAVWVLGPYPHSVALALVTIVRRRRLILGVRQDMPQYVRNRRPERRWMHVSADALEAVWRLLARRHAVVVVGPELQRKYRRSRALLAITVSLVRERDIARVDDAISARDYGGELTVLTVGRLDAEKNPLLLAEVMARLRADERGWRMIVVGEGPEAPKLAQRLADLGLLERVELRGYVPIDGGLLELYRECHVFLHVSWTEGFPQVLQEAFATGLPAVATDVGGVAAGADGAVLLIAPGDAAAAAAELRRIASDAGLRARLVETGLAHAREHTLEATTARLVAFLQSAP